MVGRYVPRHNHEGETRDPQHPDMQSWSLSHSSPAALSFGASTQRGVRQLRSERASIYVGCDAEEKPLVVEMQRFENIYFNINQQYGPALTWRQSGAWRV